MVTSQARSHLLTESAVRASSSRLRPAGTAGQILCPAVVGRDGLLATLLKRVAAARGDVVAVLGEAGIGKSRLLRKLERRAGEAGALVVGGRAVQGTQPAPYRPLAEALIAACRRTGPPQDPELAPTAPR